VKAAGALLEAALRWLADHTPATADLVRLPDATPVPCGQSAVTAKRSDLFGWAGYGYCPSHSRWYWGSKLMLMCTCEGTVTGFGLANPKLAGERDQARQIRPAAPVGALKPRARPTARSQDNPNGVGPIRRSGRDPGSDPTTTSGRNLGCRAGALSTSSLPTMCGCRRRVTARVVRADAPVLCGLLAEWRSHREYDRA
jgi:hypothetical protein